MKLPNKLRFYLGMKSVASYREKYVLTRRVGFIFWRSFFDAADGRWWPQLYSKSYFNSAEEAYQALGSWDVKPI